uniref:Uncharacterized protein n=1 Tax=Nelumbo nucifera TaxID=4432 RepID=A0A822XZR8_NELNU|nr:TPA_asm: hypothetical protein HUJ06_025960 [Nelumbo nucifera]
MRPMADVFVLSGYLINGYIFRLHALDKGKAYQNSGMVVVTDTTLHTSERDMHGIRSDIQYYGRIKEIIKLRYTEDVSFVLFQCLVETEGDVAYMDGAPIFSIMARENIHINDESIEWVRDDVAPDVVENISNIAQSRTSEQLDGQFINDSLEEDVPDESTSDTNSYIPLSDDSD